MATPKPPKAILFDIGGVVVVSPFQAILDYEIANQIPVGWINFSIQKGPPDTGAWQQIERGERELDDAWFEAFKAQLSKPDHWREYITTKVRKDANNTSPLPPIPEIDAKKLFWGMMRISRTPDPYMYPALKRLRESGKFVLAALSNTVVFPTGVLDDEGRLFTKDLIHPPAPHPHANDPTNIAPVFDTFLSSAHIGVRKPDPKAYELAVAECDRVAKEKGDNDGVKAGEVLFLDDIGVNLKFAKKVGLRTIKVDLGKTKDAVKELERQTGMKLLDEQMAKL